ncbi:hypothetical protein GCM10027399_03580 [Curvibacter fontanus]
MSRALLVQILERLHELRLARELEASNDVRLQAVRLPMPHDGAGADADAQGLAHHARAHSSVIALVMSERHSDEPDLRKIGMRHKEAPIMTARPLAIANSARFKLSCGVTGVAEALPPFCPRAVFCGAGRYDPPPVSFSSARSSVG